MPEGRLEDGALLNERYRIIRVIGQGGMGTVYRAEHERLKSVVAVKEIRATPSENTAHRVTLEQYEREAQFLVRLNHPNLPKVTDAFVDSDRFYLVMDFVEGATLDHCLRMGGGKPIDPGTVVNLAIEIVDVLRYLHSQNPPIIFRDLKPSNVMVQPDRHIKLIDFGIARRFQPGATKDTSLLGRVGYSPPDQFGRHQTDKRSDIYSLGATMHHLLTARDPSISPFKFAPLEQVIPGVPNSLSRLVANCVAMEPNLRPPDVEVVAAELIAIRNILNGVGLPPVQAPAVTALQIPTRMSTIGGQSPWMPATTSQHVYGGNSRSSSHSKRTSPMFRFSVLLLVTGLFSAVAINVGNGARPVKPKKHPAHNSRSHASAASGNRYRFTNPIRGASSEDSSSSSASGSESSDSGDQASVDGDRASSDGDSGNPSSETKSALCSAEVVGTSPDGKSLRLHVTGEINGMKDSAGKVAAYFYHTDRTPMRSLEPKGANATSSGQLFAELTFEIGADSQTVDELIDIPVDLFSSTKKGLFKCIIYADNQSAGQTELMPFSPELFASSGS